MKQVSSDLETRLDWAVVDRWDTDNPHTYKVLRGLTTHGQDLVIAPDYMSYCKRGRASVLATN